MRTVTCRLSAAFLTAPDSDDPGYQKNTAIEASFVEYQNMNSNIRVGTASWSDPGFIKDWYPKGMRAQERLGWYATHFDYVEVNSTFYGVPDKRTTTGWHEATPPGFLFDVKLHKLLSRHSTQKKMLPPKLQKGIEGGPEARVKLTDDLENALVDEILEAVSPLGSKFGAFLLQLSPEFSPRKHQLEELDSLANRLKACKLAVEFRNRGWVTGSQRDTTQRYLESHKLTFVGVDAPNEEHFTVMPSMDLVTAPDLAYLRLHGRDAKAFLKGKTVARRFDYEYSEAELKEVAGRTKDLAKKARDVHVVFNNNNLDKAPRAGIELKHLLELS